MTVDFLDKNRVDAALRPEIEELGLFLDVRHVRRTIAGLETTMLADWGHERSALTSSLLRLSP